MTWLVLSWNNPHKSGSLIEIGWVSGFAAAQDSVMEDTRPPFAEAVQAVGIVACAPVPVETHWLSLPR